MCACVIVYRGHTTGMGEDPCTSGLANFGNKVWQLCIGVPCAPIASGQLLGQWRIAMARGTKRKVIDEPIAPTDDGDSVDAGDPGADQSSSEDSSDSGGSGSDDAGEEDEADSDNEEETVDVDLEFFDPAERDFHGLKALLKTYLDGNEFTGCSELVEMIIKQVCPHRQHNSEWSVVITLCRPCPSYRGACEVCSNAHNRLCILCAEDGWDCGKDIRGR